MPAECGLWGGVIWEGERSVWGIKQEEDGEGHSSVPQEKALGEAELREKWKAQEGTKERVD